MIIYIFNQRWQSVTHSVFDVENTINPYALPANINRSGASREPVLHYCSSSLLIYGFRIFLVVKKFHISFHFTYCYTNNNNYCSDNKTTTTFTITYLCCSSSSPPSVAHHVNFPYPLPPRGPIQQSTAKPCPNNHTLRLSSPVQVPACVILPYTGRTRTYPNFFGSELHSPYSSSLIFPAFHTLFLINPSTFWSFRSRNVYDRHPTNSHYTSNFCMSPRFHCYSSSVISSVSLPLPPSHGFPQPQFPLPPPHVTPPSRYPLPSRQITPHISQLPPPRSTPTTPSPVRPPHEHNNSIRPSHQHISPRLLPLRIGLPALHLITQRRYQVQI